MRTDYNREDLGERESERETGREGEKERGSEGWMGGILHWLWPYQENNGKLIMDLSEGTRVESPPGSLLGFAHGFPRHGKPRTHAEQTVLFAEINTRVGGCVFLDP